ncbi:hypothetical protein [Sphingomonas sp. BK580]|uniref:hypothetical protein n=1 Tax=Sphingomonas sp. BK580 TaxID=2586972 RepID=UPI001616B494|nr:hypothetical protein [Sphingomonas sp. BK580]MBB3694874.1 hypothetical protein [Sphingomonas sp. BK580]
MAEIMKMEAAREAVETLKLVTPAAIGTIAGLLQDDMRDHPRAVAANYRKAGDQISDAEKRDLGIRKNAFLSREALARLTIEGRLEPLTAHERTLLRATFTLIRGRRIAKEVELQVQLGKAFLGFEHEILGRQCPACNRLDGIVSDAANAHVLPPSDCVAGCTANYGLRPKIDFLADLD